MNIETRLARLQRDISSIRNVCILAHVDHGKTTMADALISSNGIISQGSAGKLRYMDSRLDEQEKGITMKSSAISLYYCSEDRKEYMINLIDSPGHIDFFGEVSSAVRLCDGAIVLVDVVEGVCPQTRFVLRQAWMQKIKPMLVLNKIDRLILELKMTPEEAETRLLHLLEQVNAVIGELVATDVVAKSSMESNQKKDTEEIRHKFDLHEWGTGLEDLDDSLLYFSPDQGNVVFSSAIDGWGFRVSKFSKVYARKLGVDVEILSKSLWGDFYFDAKTKSVKRGARKLGRKTLFVQLILENVWKVYDAVCNKRDEAQVQKIIEVLGLKVTIRRSVSKETLQSIFAQWLPLANSILTTICQLLPDPSSISEERVLSFLKSNSSIDSVPQETMSLKGALSSCKSSESSPTIVFISKMFPFESKCLPQNQPQYKFESLTPEERLAKREALMKKRAMNGGAQPPVNNVTPAESVVEKESGNAQTFIAFARIFSGTIKRGQSLFVFGPRHDPNNVKNVDLQSDNVEEKLKEINVAKVRVGELYMLMGKDLKLLDEVPAGNVLGIGGLEELVFKSASVSDSIFCPSFTDTLQDVSPIVRVAVKPKQTGNMSKLVRGLKLLSRSDPCVEVMQERGELVLMTAGELHLEKCIIDLEERFAQIPISVSSPTVPFRETIVPPPTVDRVNELIVEQTTSAKQDRDESPSDDLDSDVGNLAVRAVPLSTDVVNILSENSQLIKLCVNKMKAGKEVDEDSLMSLDVLKEKLKDLLSKDVGLKELSADNVWYIDPKRSCSNILINQVPGYDRPSFWNLMGCRSHSLDSGLRVMDSAIVNGFEMACSSGPLCEEPMFGVCFVVERWSECSPDSDGGRPSENGGRSDEIESENEIDEEKCEVVHQIRSKFDGGLISCMKESCMKAFQAHPQRLMWPMYTCVIQATADVLGKLNDVVKKMHGRILSDEMMEGSSLFEVLAHVPVVECFGFADAFRKKTRGLAMPHLKFSHWEVVDIDPFWVPTTEEEYALFGEKADFENIARKYMNDVRKRKGLQTSEKLVEFGEKQRTLKKNK